MDLTDELFDNSPAGVRQDEQAVIICLQFPIGKFEEQKALDAVFDLDKILRNVIETSDTGRYVGNEFYKGSEDERVKFFIYGKSASTIYQVIKPIFQSMQNLTSYYIIKRYAAFSEELYPN